MHIAESTVECDAYECEAIVRDYYARTIASEGMWPLKFKWDVYKQLEAVDACKLFVAKNDDMLIGFALYVVQPHFHHDGQNVAQCTLIGVRPEFRNIGVGRQLVEHAIRWFKQHGATHIVHHHRSIYKVKPLFERMGFKLEELAYVKEL